MKFKLHFRIFTLAWAVTVLVLSDVFLISSFRSITLDPEKSSPLPMMISVPTAFAAAGIALVGVFSRLVIRRLRRHYFSLEGVTEYTFFRNFVLILAAGAAANTLLLYTRYRAVAEMLLKEEDRHIRLMYSDQPDYLQQCLSALADRVSACNTTAVIMTVLLFAAKAAACLFLARGMVRTYQRNVRLAYTS
ncbi:MAG: hypothetical protein IJR91_02085 [Ruminococcus sp.]|nr:hypothetical protein [Ruminococcus sp.]